MLQTALVEVRNLNPTTTNPLLPTLAYLLQMRIHWLVLIAQVNAFSVILTTCSNNPVVYGCRLTTTQAFLKANNTVDAAVLNGILRQLAIFCIEIGTSFPFNAIITDGVLVKILAISKLTCNQQAIAALVVK